MTFLWVEGMDRASGFGKRRRFAEARLILALIGQKSRESTLAVAKLLTLCYSFKLPWLGSNLHKWLAFNDLYRIGSEFAGVGPGYPVGILWKTLVASGIVP
jgi:hypothetical protein